MKLGLSLARSARQGAWHGRGRAAALHGRHDDISPNTWQAPKWVGWDAYLGHFRADLGLGPKIKFALLLKLYNFD
jgi:hypothetical protein